MIKGTGRRYREEGKGERVVKKAYQHSFRRKCKPFLIKE
jgi:hypothetical protein